MVTVTAITRFEESQVRSIKGWLLIYGRRKVGKTFLVRNFIDHDMYVLVKRGGGAFIEGGPLERSDDYEQVIRFITKALEEGKTVVVDEFQRLPEDFLDALQFCHPKGKVILCGSNMHVAKEINSKKSPLLGLISEVKLSLIRPSEILCALSEVVSPEHVIAIAPYLRDPWSLHHLDKTPERTITNVLTYSRNAIPALIGEVFQAEDRHLSEVYEGTLRSIASGKNTLKEVSDVLYSRKLIKTNSPTQIRQYVKNMEDMDLIERIPLYESKGNVYSVKSKLMDMYYYLDEKYDIEAGEPGLIEEVIKDRTPLHIQSFLGEVMAEVLGGAFRYYRNSDYDIDIMITKRGKPVFIAEVKWTKKVRNKDIYKFLENTEKFSCRKALISKSGVETDEIEVITPDRLLEMVRAK